MGMTSHAERTFRSRPHTPQSVTSSLSLSLLLTQWLQVPRPYRQGGHAPFLYGSSSATLDVVLNRTQRESGQLPITYTTCYPNGGGR